MFEVGKTYSLEWTEGSEHHYQSGEALAWQEPLLKVRLRDGERIINTASSTFVGASEKASEALDIKALLGDFGDV